MNVKNQLNMFFEKTYHSFPLRNGTNSQICNIKYYFKVILVQFPTLFSIHYGRNVDSQQNTVKRKIQIFVHESITVCTQE